MDWLQFIAAVVGHLAWPAVLLVLLFFLRTQIASLAFQLEELTLPGGAKAKFDKQLDQARQESEKVQIERSDAIPDQSQSRDRDAELAEKFPEAAVVEAFRKLELKLQVIKLHMPMLPLRTTMVALVQTMLDLQLIDAHEYELYINLREARNAAVHARVRLTPGEAFEYQQRAAIMSGVLDRVLNSLKGREIDTRKENSG
jgi:hypothetical protein